jgi:YHS domain-containing protein
MVKGAVIGVFIAVKFELILCLVLKALKQLNMTLRFRFFLVGFTLLAACNSVSQKDKNPVLAPAATVIMPADSTKSYDQALVDNKKDPSCGMPVTAGISDTLHFKGKVLGFCSTECKDSFLKDSTKAFAAVEFKK